MVFWFLLLLALPHSQAGFHSHIPRDELDAGIDIPTQGSSLFDKIFSRQGANGGTHYFVPFPIDSLLQEIKEPNRNNSLIFTMLPFSRSLQRPTSLAFDPILNPRLVVAANSNPIYKGKLFIGYLKPADQLEVISYNDEAGRFEFQIVKNYSKNPEVYYVNRGKCLSCHQGQAPIFSIPAWRDTSSGLMSEIIDAKLGLEGNNEIELRKKELELLFETSAAQDSIAVLDSLVRIGEKISFEERVWAFGCGDNTNCKIGLLLRTFAPNATITQGFYSQSLAVIEHSPLKEQRKFHSFLSSTDLGLVEVAKKYAPSSTPTYEGILNNPQAVLEIISNIGKLDPADNPATPRIHYLKDRDLTPPKLSTFDLKEVSTIQDAATGQNQIAEFIVSLRETQPELFQSPSINKLAWMKALLTKFSPSKAKDYEMVLAKVTPPKAYLPVVGLPIFQRTELNVMARNCAKCHATGGNYPPQFLLAKESEVLGYLKFYKTRFLLKLKNNLMPPTKELRDQMESSGDGKIILDFLESLE